MSAVKPIVSEEAFQEHKGSLPSSTLLVISFHTPWAAPCAQMAAVLSALASTYPVQEPALISFVSIDAEALPDISDSYDVTAVPFLVLQKGEDTLETVSGSDAAKVRTAIEAQFAKLHPGHKGGPIGTTLPPAQTVTKPEQPSTTNGVVKDLSGYAATEAPKPESTQMTPEELHTRLSALVTAAPVMLFMKGTPSSPQCGFSRQLVALLRSNGIRYGFFNILADEEVRQGLKKFADWPTYPQLWTKGELLGGLDIVKEEFEADPSFLKEFAATTQETVEA